MPLRMNKVLGIGFLSDLHAHRINDLASVLDAPRLHQRGSALSERRPSRTDRPARARECASGNCPRLRS
jgi:hypothetical protein